MSDRLCEESCKFPPFAFAKYALCMAGVYFIAIAKDEIGDALIL